MPPKRRIVAAASRLDRARARRSLGPLRTLLVSQRTLRYRYRPACIRFFDWLARQNVSLAQTTMGIDEQVSSYIEHLWEEGDGRNMAGDVLSALTFFCPHLKGSLFGGWQLFKAWSRQELPARAPPMPEQWVLAAAALAVRRGWGDIAVLLCVAYFGLLRTMEAACLLAKDCVPAADHSRWVLSLGLTKGGQRRGAVESVVIANPLAGALLRAAVTGQPKGSFLLRRPVAEFRKHFQTLMWELGLAHFKFQPYSLRRGGATQVFRNTGSFDNVSELGRWGHVATARIYINEGLATLSQITIAPNHAQVLRQLAGELCDRCKVPYDW